MSSMNSTHKSDSSEQLQAERVIFSMIEQRLGVKLEQNRKIFLADNSHTYIQPDFYSESDRIIGEIFAHIGKPKKAQDNKIANDILKMLLLEKITKEQYRKLIVVCDAAELKKLHGLSALAESIRQFNIEVLYVEIDENTREQIIEAQQRQRMVNA